MQLVDARGCKPKQKVVHLKTVQEVRPGPLVRLVRLVRSPQLLPSRRSVPWVPPGRLVPEVRPAR